MSILIQGLLSLLVFHHFLNYFNLRSYLRFLLFVGWYILFVCMCVFVCVCVCVCVRVWAAVIAGLNLAVPARYGRPVE